MTFASNSQWEVPRLLPEMLPPRAEASHHFTFVCHWQPTGEPWQRPWRHQQPARVDFPNLQGSRAQVYMGMKTPRNLAWRRSLALPQRGNSSPSGWVASLLLQLSTAPGKAGASHGSRSRLLGSHPQHLVCMRTRFGGYEASRLKCTASPTSFSKALA